MSIKSMACHAKTAAKMHSPTIMIIGGVTLTVSAVVLAVKAKSKADDAKNKMNSALDIIGYEDYKEAVQENPSSKNEEIEKAVARTKINYGVSVVKAYSIPVAAEIAGVALILGSHSIMQKRCAAIVTAYNAASATLATFYGHVKEELGEEKTDILFKKAQDSAIPRVSADSLYDQIVQDDERAQRTGLGYWVDFSPSATRMCKDDYAHDLVFLKAQEMFANDRLRTYGVVTLNEVLDSLGYDPTDAGLIVGWSTANGDEYIDFGLNRPANKAWHDSEGRCGYCTLKFNTQGVIYGTVNHGLKSLNEGSDE